MQPMHPAMVEAHARARVEQLRHEERTRCRSIRGGPRRHRLRISAGWVLINVGLRLALPAAPVVPAAG